MAGGKLRAHLRGNHSKGEWSRQTARIAVHANRVESFNATIKRAIMGMFHRFSIKRDDRQRILR